MATHYFKRYRMELDLREMESGRVVLPDGYRWHPWSPLLLREHAQVKFASFQHENDRFLFPSLGALSGCEKLMRAITSHSGFLPQATWLIEEIAEEAGKSTLCGTIQGLVNNTTSGEIQNLGVHPFYRGKGLGRALMLKALRGFRSVGMLRVSLDVTADNLPAVQLYRSLGFRYVSTSYRQLPQPVE